MTPQSARLQALLLVHAALLAACAERTIAERDGIRHDDFEYSVSRVDKLERIGQITARGMFYLVTFSVENHARRVAHAWHNNTAYLVDERGRTYDNEPAAQRALQQLKPFGLKGKYLTTAGTVDTTVFVFDVPRGVKEPYLKVRGDFLMGDLFDANQYKRTRVKLF
jgi:hypothetical protein